MTSLRSDLAFDPMGRASPDPHKGHARDLALATLANEASLLALTAGKEAALVGPGSTAAAMAMATLAAETERVARRIERAIDAMRRLDPSQGPSDAQIAAATAALAAARAIGKHCHSPAEGTRVAADGFASAAAALDTRARDKGVTTAGAGPNSH